MTVATTFFETDTDTTWFQLILLAPNLMVTKNLTLHVEGPQIYQMNRQINSFQNICDTLLAKIDCLARKINFVQKITSKSPILVGTNLAYLTLEGPGRQTGDTRSTPGLPLTRYHLMYTIPIQKIEQIANDPFFGLFLVDGSPDYIANSAIFEIRVLWVIFMDSITLYV